MTKEKHRFVSVFFFSGCGTQPVCDLRDGDINAFTSHGLGIIGIDGCAPQLRPCTVEAPQGSFGVLVESLPDVSRSRGQISILDILDS